MTAEDFFLQAFIYLTAAVVSVPLARRFGLGSVLGYLLAGIVIGPFVLGLVGDNGDGVLHFAEFGVVMMLFVIGLELEPALLWRLRAPILGLGGLQVCATTLLFFLVGSLGGLPWQQALALGMTFSLSSTAIVLQTLKEKSLLRTAGGESSFSVLLFQDIAVVPMLAIFPLLAIAGVGGEGATHAASEGWISQLPSWARALAVLSAVALIVLGGRYLLQPVFRLLGRARMREVFTAAVLLIVIGISLLMTRVGLSPALGAFLAGVVLANSEYRLELEADIEPFKGLLLGLFFIAVGASIDFSLIGQQPGLIAGATLGVMAVKFSVLLALARIFGLGTPQALLFAFALPQVGEFAFVLLSFAGQEGVLGPEITRPMTVVTALSMALTPLLLVLKDRVILPRFGTPRLPERTPDVIEERNPVLIAGFGAFGSTVGRLLRAKGVETTVLEMDSDRVEVLRRLGLHCYYGDATRHDLLEAAGASQARILIIALDSPESTLALAKMARRNFPHLTLMARAYDWQDAHDLQEASVDFVYRQSLDTSLRLGTDALRILGHRSHSAVRAAETFLRHDEASLSHLTAERRLHSSDYLSEVRRHIEDLERLLLSDQKDGDLNRDAGWDPESLREEFQDRG